jgi:hypothetical protein
MVVGRVVGNELRGVRVDRTRLVVEVRGNYTEYPLNFNAGDMPTRQRPRDPWKASVVDENLAISLEVALLFSLILVALCPQIRFSSGRFGRRFCSRGPGRASEDMTLETVETRPETNLVTSLILLALMLVSNIVIGLHR